MMVFNYILKRLKFAYMPVQLSIHICDTSDQKGEKMHQI